jgi:hemolysin III
MSVPAVTSAASNEAEEWANCLTHAVGVLLGLVGMAVLVTLSARRGDPWEVVAACVFGVSLVLLYTASTLYHTFRQPEMKRLLRKFDHAAIFLLIAGTYTPFLLVSLRGPWGWSLFGIIWGLAVAGMVLKFWFAGRFTIVSTLLYLAMGWLVVVATRPMLAAVAPTQLWFLLAGGFCYSGGTVFYLWRSLPYHHAVWHLFVLGGSICHYFAVYGTLVRPA